MKLWEGNVFTGVCHSVHGWGGRYPLPPKFIQSGRYASYRNAFFLKLLVSFVEHVKGFSSVTIPAKCTQRMATGLVFFMNIQTK